MKRTLVVTGSHFEPSSPGEAPVQVSNMGLSTVQLVKMANADATGIRANLHINDSSALDALAHHYAEQTSLDWTFEFGGGAEPITVSLRWTKFEKDEGYVQVVRNVVMRDLIAEVGGSISADASSPLTRAA